MIFVSHKYGDDPEGNIKALEEVIPRLREFIGKDKHLFVPHFMYPHYMSDDDERARVMDFCMDAIDGCEALVVITRVGEHPSRGMNKEIGYARSHDVPAYRFFYDENEITETGPF